MVEGREGRRGVGAEAGAAGAAAVWRSWCKWSRLLSFRLWSGSRNNPVLHRQRGGHPCRQQRQVFRVPFFQFIYRGMDTSCSCDTGTHGVQTLQKTVDVIMQFEFQQSKLYDLNVLQIQCIDGVLDIPSGTHVAATFWVNASRVIPPLTIGNVKNPSIFILSLQEKRKKKQRKTGHTEKTKKEKE